MAKAKDKVMLQFPVKKGVALTWHKVVKVSGNTQGDLFTCIFADFLNKARQVAKKKGGEKNAKESNKKA